MRGDLDVQPRLAPARLLLTPSGMFLPPLTAPEMSRTVPLLFASAVLTLLPGQTRVTCRAGEAGTLQPSPERVVLASPEASAQVIVSSRSASGIAVDVTRQVEYSMVDPKIAHVLATGRVLPRGAGQTSLQIRLGPLVTSVSIEVQGLESPSPVSFHRDVLPILTKAGCNSGGCHGKAEGQNGFKLSVFGFDPTADHAAIVREARGRRIQHAAPEDSLLLRKATAQVPHGGGRKLEPDSGWYLQVRRWIAEGTTLDNPSEQRVTAISVSPAEADLEPMGTQQLRVIAVDGDGRSRCVTAEADFQSNAEPIASVDRDGLVTATQVPGEAAILVRYAGQVATCRITRPRGTPGAGVVDRPPERNFVDGLVWDKLQRLGVAPSSLVDDATFLRRVFLDTIGTLPTPAETRTFLADVDPEKRRMLVRTLLDRPEYADYWAQRWSDWLRVDRDRITPQATVAMTRWIHHQLEKNTPFDEFARAVVTAEGNTLSESPVAFFQVHDQPESLARAISQLFLGVRIECAQCHHHPFERWDQQDYFALAGFFTGVQRTPLPQGGMKIRGLAGMDLPHPRTGELIPAAGLGTPPARIADLPDRRRAFAAWMTDPANPYFTRTIVNRLWAHYLGRGLFEPIDDQRGTNPAANEPLLRALAAHLVELRYDLRAFTRTLLDSRVYQLSVETNETNALDEQNYSHAAWKPLPAEVLADAIAQATGVPDEFNGWPVGYRAIQVWDNQTPSPFFRVFGRPTRQTVCSCERGTEPSMAQALHLMNSPETARKLSHRKGFAARLAASSRTSQELIDELYLAALSRFPTAEEQSALGSAFPATPAGMDSPAPTGTSNLARQASLARQAAVEDILWTLLNTKEFVYNH